MKVLLKPWFAVALLAVAVAVWAFTVGPWGPWRYETTSVRLETQGTAVARQSARSPQLSLNGGPATLKVSAAPAASTTLIADVRWRLIPTPSRHSQAASGDEGLMSPDLVAGPYDLKDDLGLEPSGGFRLDVSAASDAPALIVATIAEERGYWFGVPAFGLILAAGLAYVGLAVALERRQYPPNPPLARQRHEFE
jgi:hypothetical protein